MAGRMESDWLQEGQLAQVQGNVTSGFPFSFLLTHVCERAHIPHAYTQAQHTQVPDMHTTPHSPHTQSTSHICWTAHHHTHTYRAHTPDINTTPHTHSPTLTPHHTQSTPHAYHAAHTHQIYTAHHAFTHSHIQHTAHTPDVHSTLYSHTHTQHSCTLIHPEGHHTHHTVLTHSVLTHHSTQHSHTHHTHTNTLYTTHPHTYLLSPPDCDTHTHTIPYIFLCRLPGKHFPVLAQLDRPGKAL